jgi:hypothetical protein
MAYDGRGAAYSGKGDYDGAVDDFSLAIKLDPGVALSYYNRRSTYWSHTRDGVSVRGWRKTGRHANQRCHSILDRGTGWASASCYNNAHVGTAVPLFDREPKLRGATYLTSLSLSTREICG